MRAAGLALLLAAAVAWGAPPVLARLTAAGASARLGLTAWLAAIGAVLGCLALALGHLVAAAVAGWHYLAEAFCLSVTGHACAAPVYRSAIIEVPLAAAATVAGLTALGLAWRYGRWVQRAQQRTRSHARAARITGRQLPAAGGAVVLDASQPAAYCVPGRPAAVVVTTGALAVLEPEQLDAVIAHEHAHLAGRHHALLALSRALAVTLPGVPVASRATGAIARLTEMRADDKAARRTSCPVVASALLAMSTGAAVPAGALAAAGAHVAARVDRLLAPPDPARRARNRLALLGVLAVLAALFALMPVAG